MVRRRALLALCSAILCSMVTAQRNVTTTAATTPATAGVCNDQQFFCQDSQNKCIPLEWVCDNVKDCSNGKDEANCRYLGNCPDGYLLCRNYACVAASLKCDGFDDCNDGSDERGCPELPQVSSIMSPTTCPLDMYQCRRGPCISLGAVCDGLQDCPEGDDETECDADALKRRKQCNPENQFTCEKDHNCIPKSWMCDGMEDCSDGSDEHFCADGNPIFDRNDYFHILPNMPSSNCTHEEFRCSGDERKCIPLSKMCNKVDDCPNGDDEGGFCGSCATYGCERMCIDSPLGPTCKCGAGETVGDDSKSCVDVDECLEHGEGHATCDQICMNTQGSYTCSCAPGFTLHSDGRKCILQESEKGRLLVSFGHEVRTIPLTSQMSNNVPYGPVMANEDVGGMIHGLDYSSADERLYMTVSSVGGRQGSIHAYREKQRCIVDHLSGISNVAVDWITGNIYYTAGSPSRRPGVGVCTNDGRFCHLLVSDNEMHRFRGLALHPRRGLMFWSDWGSHGPKIEQSSMDGKKRRTLIDDKLEWPNGLTIDYIKEQLYFTDAQLQTIERVDIFSGRRTVVTTQGVHHPFDLVVFDGHLFWTDWHIEAVVVTTISNISDRHVVHSLPQVPYGLAIDHSAYHQLKAGQNNPCQQAKCSHMCLLASAKGDFHPTASCVCPDHYSLQGERCMPLNETERRKRDLDKAPEICMSLLLDYCKEDMACFNGGQCVAARTVGGKMSSVSCECPPGFVGHYCEVPLTAEELGSEEGSGSAAIVIILLTLLILLVVLVGCCVRRSGIGSRISPDSMRKGPLRSVSMKTPLMVRFATSNNQPEDKQRILANEETETETIEQRSVSPVSSRRPWTSPESFANPMYDENNPYAPTTAVVDDVFDATVHPAPPKKDNDSGLGSGSVLLNV